MVTHLATKQKTELHRNVDVITVPTPTTTSTPNLLLYPVQHEYTKLSHGTRPLQTGLQISFSELALKHNKQERQFRIFTGRLRAY